jgi:hypothetical protein
MKQITIRGYSDDLIEIEGDLTEEFSASFDDVDIISVSDGHLLEIRYDDNGVWRITPIFHGKAAYAKTEGVMDSHDYSDIVTLTLPDDQIFQWVACKNSFTS